MFSFFRRRTISPLPATVLAVAAVVGMADSLFLMLQYVDALKNPGAVTPCSVSSFVNCTKTVQGAYGHYVPGVPNPLWGMLWYAGLAAYGAVRSRGAIIGREARSFVGITLILGLLFSYRLYFASIFELGGVCPFCLLSTTASTACAVAFVIDDRDYRDALLGGLWLRIFHAFQLFSVAVFVVGLPLFIGRALHFTPDPLPVMQHWSFPFMVVLVTVMAAVHAWGWRASTR